MDVLNLLQKQLEKRSVGSLLLGEKNSFREIFFENDQVFLCSDRFSGLVDIAAVDELGAVGDTISESGLEELIARMDLERELLPQILADHSAIAKEKLPDLLEKQMIEEMLALIIRNEDSFHFQEGRVPEVLLEGPENLQAVPLSTLIDAAKRRYEEIQELRLVLPSPDEVFVQTAEGMAYVQTAQNDYGFQRLFSLIDGFRNLRSLVECSRCYSHYVLRRIASALEAEHLKKRNLPEIREIEPSNITKDKASELLPLFKNAVKYAVDPTEAREKLAALYEKTGDVENAVVQYNFIGDTLFRMKKGERAIETYQRALELKPGDVMVTDKISRIYQDRAEQDLVDGDINSAIRLFESALEVRPDDRAVFQRLASILTTHKRLNYLSDLCDRVILKSKKTNNIDIGVAACREILEVLPESPQFHKKLVNVYLDFNDTDAAAQEMATLARIFAKRGARDRGLDLAEKIKRMKGSPEISRIHRSLAEDLGIRARASRKRTALAGLFFVFLLALGGYQAISFSEWRKISPESGFAYADSSSEELVLDDRIDPIKTELEMLRSRCVEFSKLYPISIFRVQADEFARKCDIALSQRGRLRREAKQELIERARVQAAEGNADSVNGVLAPLLELAAEDPWRIHATKIAAAQHSISESARGLYDRARELERQEDWVGAFATYENLMATFPKSKLVSSVKLPIRLTSIPSNASVYAGFDSDRLLGTTPLVLRLQNGDLQAIRLELNGHHPSNIEVGSTSGSPEAVLVERKPRNALTLNFKTIETVLVGDRLVVTDDSGGVHALNAKTGRKLWSQQRDNLNWLLGSPAMSDEGTYLVWNDRLVQLITEPKGSGIKPTVVAEAKLSGLAKSSAIVLDGSLIAIGTSRKSVSFFQRKSLRPRGEAQLDFVPTTLVSLGGARLLAVSDAGVIAAVDTDLDRVLWRKDTESPLTMKPVAIGDSVIIATEAGDVMGLNPSNGLPRFVEAFGSGSHVSASPKAKRVYVATTDGKLLSLAPRTGKVLAERQFRFDDMKPFPSGSRLAISYFDNLRVMVLDPSTLETLWGCRPAQSARSFVASDDHLIAERKLRAGTRLELFDGNDYAAPPPDDADEVTAPKD